MPLSTMVAKSGHRRARKNVKGTKQTMGQQVKVEVTVKIYYANIAVPAFGNLSSRGGNTRPPSHQLFQAHEYVVALRVAQAVGRRGWRLVARGPPLK